MMITSTPLAFAFSRTSVQRSSYLPGPNAIYLILPSASNHHPCLYRWVARLMIHLKQLGFPKPAQSHRLSVGHDLSTIEAHSQILGLRAHIIIAIRAAGGVKLVSTLQTLHHWQSFATRIGFKLSFFVFLSHICQSGRHCPRFLSHASISSLARSSSK